MDTVQQFLRARAEDERPGLRSGERVWSWREYVDECSARANALHSLLASDRPRTSACSSTHPGNGLRTGCGALGGHVTAGIN